MKYLITRLILIIMIKMRNQTILKNVKKTKILDAF